MGITIVSLFPENETDPQGLIIPQSITNGEGKHEITALAYFIDGIGTSLTHSKLRAITTATLTRNLITLANANGKAIQVKTTYNHETRQRLLTPEFEITADGTIFDVYNDPRQIGKVNT